MAGLRMVGEFSISPPKLLIGTAYIPLFKDCVYQNGSAVIQTQDALVKIREVRQNVFTKRFPRKMQFRDKSQFRITEKRTIISGRRGGGANAVKTENWEYIECVTNRYSEVRKFVRPGLFHGEHIGRRFIRPPTRWRNIWRVRFRRNISFASTK